MGAKKMWGVLLAVFLVLSGLRSGAMGAEPIKIAQVVGLTGFLEAYAKQSINGFQLFSWVLNTPPKGP